MLNSLHIKNYTLIQEQEIRFVNGLNVITGETGAGKSTIIGAIQLLLGNRADRSVIRRDTEYCLVSGVFQFDNSNPIQDKIVGILEQSGIPENDDRCSLIISRRIGKTSSRTFVNSTPITLEILKKIGHFLVDVHGPYENQSLFKKQVQLNLVDSYGQYESEICECTKSYQDLLKISEELEKCQNEVGTEEEIARLRYQTAELRNANLNEEEFIELKDRHKAVSNCNQILEILNSSLKRIDGTDAVSDQMRSIVRELLAFQKIDSEKGSLFIGFAEEVLSKLNLLRDEIGDYAEKLDIDAGAFRELEDRVDTIHKLMRKYGNEIPAMIKFSEECEEKLERIDNFGVFKKRLLKNRDDANTRYVNCANKLSGLRQNNAKILEEQITKKIQHLGLKSCTFKIGFNTIPMAARGTEMPEFQFAPNKGEGLKPLTDTASSGELSRVMLGLKTVMAEKDKTPVLVFDEIDVNIGGTVANTIGEMLYELGKFHQIICITHLPQVASYANLHLFAGKSEIDCSTEISITELSRENRIEEVTRMLGGIDSTTVVRQHAKELIDRRPI